LEITFKDLKRLRNYLYNEVGIYVEDEKLENIYKRKVLKLLQDLEYDNFDTFFKDLVLKKFSLKQKLINIFTVNETYFFREKYQFDTLVNLVLPQIDEIRKKDEVIKILCSPVSTGEELYSIAIMLLEEDNLIRKRDFMLLGIDIDSNVIQKAKNGVFSHRSVHKLPQNLIDKYFIKKDDGYHIKDFLKKACNFKVVNVMDKYSMKKLGSFDVIFSRNMLIYFDERSKREVIATYHNMLKENGYLFLGHAERISSDIKLFESIKLGDSFVYKKNTDS